MDTGHNPAYTTGNSDPAASLPSRKRRRLNFACNYCRSRKTRCDERRPSCQACTLAGVKCITEDKRRPGKIIQRHEAGKDGNDTSFVSEGSTENLLQSQHQDIFAPDPHGSSRVTGSTTAVSPGRPSTSPRRDSSPRISTINSPLPIWRQSRGTTSFQLLSEWMDLARARLSIPYHINADALSNVDPTLRSSGAGHSFASPIPVVLSSDLPLIPGEWALSAFIDTYERHIHAFHPVLRLGQMRAALSHIDECRHSGRPFTYDQENALRVHLLAAVSGCVLKLNGCHTFIASMLSVARRSLGHLAGEMTLDALEVLFLMAVCLRHGDELTTAWTVLGICVSKAQFLRLNRPGEVDGRHDDPLDPENRNTIWWALYSYEKLFSFQLGFTSHIPDEVYDEGGINLAPKSSGFSHTVLSMAKVLSRISHRCIKARQLEEKANRGRLEAAIRDKVAATGESFLLLKNWADSLPPDLRPTPDVIHLSDNLPLATFISLHYHNAIILLFRNSLLISQEALHRSVEIIAKDAPWERPIRCGQWLAATSARRVITMLTEMSESRVSFMMPAYFPLLHALYVLGVYVRTQPQSRMTRIDHSLLHTASDLLKSIFDEKGAFPSLITALDTLIREIDEASGSPAPAATGRHDTTSLANLEAGQPNVGRPPEMTDPEFDALSASFDEAVFESAPEQNVMGFALPDEIGCDWAGFEMLLQRLESERNFAAVE